MRKAIDALVDASAKVDDDQFHSEMHFDAENFVGGQRRVVGLLELTISSIKEGKAELARYDLGSALHTIQDFYAHSNWVELGNTGANPDLGRPGRTIGAVAGPTEPTCDGSTLITDKLTSGYYSGEDRKPAIASKCRHGGPFDHSPGSGGINKDTRRTTLSPHAEYHDAAVGAALLATLQFLRDIKEKITPRELRLLLGAGPTLGMSIDTTGSMADIIDGVKTQAISIVDARLGTDDEPTQYTLMPFNDPGMGPGLTTQDPAVFEKAISSLPAVAGGDCPEMSMSGAIQALAAMDQGGDMFLFTDASSKDASLAANVSGLAATKDVAVYPMVFGSCSPLDPAYVQLAGDTGGQVFFLDPADARSVTRLADFLVRANAVTLLDVAGGLDGAARDYQVPVDPTMTRVTFSVVGPEAPTLTRPDGGVVRAGDPGTEVVALSSDAGTATIVSVARPVAGSWKVALHGSGAFSVVVSGESPLDLAAFQLVRQVGSGGYEHTEDLSGYPATGQPVMVDAEITDGIRSPTYELRAMDGSVLRTVSGLTAATDTESYGEITPPATPFRAYLTGSDVSGNPVQRALRRVERPQSVIVTSPAGTELRAGRTATFTFQVRNLGSAGTFRVSVADDLGFTAAAKPATVRLAAGATGAVKVTVKVPCDVPESSLETLTLAVRSTTDADVFNFGTVTNTVVAGHAACASGATSKPGPTLPVTGSGTGLLVGVAVALAIAGVLLVLATRLRRRIRFQA